MSGKMAKKARKEMQKFLDDDSKSNLTKVLYELGQMPFPERVKNSWMILKGGPGPFWKGILGIFWKGGK